MFVPFAIVAIVILLFAGRLLFRLALRLALALCLAGIGGTALSLLLGQGAGTAVLFTILLALPVALLLRAVRRGRRARRVVGVAPAGTSSPWEALRRAVPRERRRLEAAEARCADFLRLADAGDFRPETADLQVLVGKRVPELIDHGLARAQAAGAVERQQVLDATIVSVLEAATAAEVEYRTLWQASGNRFDAQRAHLASRLRPGPLSSI